MKVLLVCAAGMSTSILMKKMKRYAVENGIELEIEAVGLSAYKEVCNKYDCILVGPQVSYQKDIIAKECGKPIDVIAPKDYGVGNVENIFVQINHLLNQ